MGARGIWGGLSFTKAWGAHRGRDDGTASSQETQRLSLCVLRVCERNVQR
ncbi:hypothetical protein RB213_000242 [Colletotrichum asianum]